MTLYDTDYYALKEGKLSLYQGFTGLDAKGVFVPYGGEKMVSKKPTKKQLDFLSWERGVFFHFGIRTFYEGHRDWDGKIMPYVSI